MEVNVPRIKLGSQGLEVSKQGLGCMGMSFMYGPPKPEPDMIKLIHHAIDSGVTFLDTSDYYGPNTNEILIGKIVYGLSICLLVTMMIPRRGCTPSQLALAWVHHQGDNVSPIPGTTKIENFNENVGALLVKLTPEQMIELESYASADVVKAERPPLSSWKAK